MMVKYVVLFTNDDQRWIMNVALSYCNQSYPIFAFVNQKHVTSWSTRLRTEFVNNNECGTDVKNLILQNYPPSNIVNQIVSRAATLEWLIVILNKQHLTLAQMNQFQDEFDSIVYFPLDTNDFIYVCSCGWGFKKIQEVYDHRKLFGHDSVRCKTCFLNIHCRNAWKRHRESTTHFEYDGYFIKPTRFFCKDLIFCKTKENCSYVKRDDRIVFAQQNLNYIPPPPYFQIHADVPADDLQDLPPPYSTIQ